MFVATVLLRFDIKLAPAPNGRKPRFPKLDEAIPSGGILSPISGDDLLVEVQRAKL